MYTPMGYHKAMRDMNKRMHRLMGQLKRADRDLERSADCAAVATQLLAAKRALDAVVRNYMEESLQECVRNRDKIRLSQMLKLFIKHF